MSPQKAKQTTVNTATSNRKNQVFSIASYQTGAMTSARVQSSATPKHSQTNSTTNE